MGPSRSVESVSEAERAALREVALRAVGCAARGGVPLLIDPLEHVPRLRLRGASFVTLRCGGELRGCTGRLEPVDPLVQDVAHSAWRAARADARFEAVREAELAALELSISVLSALEPLWAASLDELLDALRPGVDGLVLRDGVRGATFLPAMWESLPEPEEFVRALLRKARLPERHWSATLRFERYTSLDF